MGFCVSINDAETNLIDSVSKSIYLIWEIVIRNKYLKKDYALTPKYADPDVKIPDYSILNNMNPSERQTYQYFLGNQR